MKGGASWRPALLLAGPCLIGAACLVLGAQGKISHAETVGLLALTAVTEFCVARIIGAIREQVARQHLPGPDEFGDIVTWHGKDSSIMAAKVPPSHELGLDASALHGQGLFSLVHVADRPLYMKTLNEAAHGQSIAQACFRIMVSAKASAPPELFWLEMRARRVGQDPSRPGATVVATLQDVTMRRMASEAQEEAQRLVQHAEQARSRFLATVSHELRTPLNAIIGFSEILANESLRPVDESQRLDYARIIHTSGQHLLEVVNSLLDISKIESGTMAVEREAMDLAALIDSCADLMAMRAGTAGISLERIKGDALGQVVCDRRAIKQIILNLLSNALKFTPAAGTVTLSAIRDGGMIDIAVTDSGIGIRAEDLPLLGQPFFQAKGSYDRAYEGTGLGLSVVRGLVGLHGGTLEIESAPGAGTRVSLRIPADGSTGSAEPVQIATYVRSPPRGLAHVAPYRLTA